MLLFAALKGVDMRKAIILIPIVITMAFILTFSGCVINSCIKSENQQANISQEYTNATKAIDDVRGAYNNYLGVQSKASKGERTEAEANNAKNYYLDLCDIAQSQINKIPNQDEKDKAQKSFESAKKGEL